VYLAGKLVAPASSEAAAVSGQSSRLGAPTRRRSPVEEFTSDTGEVAGTERCQFVVLALGKYVIPNHPAATGRSLSTVDSASLPVIPRNAAWSWKLPLKAA